MIRRRHWWDRLLWFGFALLCGLLLVALLLNRAGQLTAAALGPWLPGALASTLLPGWLIDRFVSVRRHDKTVTWDGFRAAKLWYAAAGMTLIGQLLILDP